jgi:hypothetical protein
MIFRLANKKLQFFFSELEITSTNSTKIWKFEPVSINFYLKFKLDWRYSVGQPKWGQGPHFYKIDLFRAKFSDNFNDLVDFPLNFQFLGEVEEPQKRASNAAV